MLRKIHIFFMAFIMVLLPFMNTSIVSAQSGGAARLEITAPTTAVVGEAFDVTITAVDKEGNKATGYMSSIVFSTDYIGDTYPRPGRSIPFTAEDSGEKKFSKGVIFKKAGKQKLRVNDLVNADIAGEVNIEVLEGSGNTEQAVGEVTILTPIADGKITTSTVLVSGNTRKNSKITIELNGKKVADVVSDATGLFTYELQDITQENNILKASLIDASDNIIATSPDVKFSKTSESSSIYGLVITPGTTVEAGTDITIAIDAVKGLSSLTATLDGTLLSAKEEAEGKYKITTIAPQKEGEYPIDVLAKTLTNQETEKKKIATLTVTPKKAEEKPVETPVEAPKEEPKETPKPAFKNVKTETNKQRVNFSFSIENTPEDLDFFEISYNSGSIKTQSAKKILKENTYSWYVDSLSQGSYTFIIQAKKKDGSNIEGLKSEPLMATIGVQACTVSNVGKIHISTDVSKSVLTWEGVKEATGYNVYKIGSDGKYTLITTVKDPSYTLFLSKGAVKYDDFAIKAVCGEGTESADYTKASKVQTGPGLMAFIVVISAIASAIILRRRA